MKNREEWWRQPRRPQASKWYVVETVTIAVDDLDLATMRVGVGTGGLQAVCEIVEVGLVPGDVKEYSRQIERKRGN